MQAKRMYSAGTVIALSCLLGVVGLLLIICLTVMLVYILEALDIWRHLSHALDSHGIPAYLTPRDGYGELPSQVPDEYDEPTARYLSDMMSRYYAFFMGDTDEFLNRPGTEIVAKIYTEGGSQLSCMVFDNPSANASIVLFKGTTSRTEWGYDFMFDSRSPTSILQPLSAASGSSGSTARTHDQARLLYNSDGTLRVGSPQDSPEQMMLFATTRTTDQSERRRLQREAQDRIDARDESWAGAGTSTGFTPQPPHSTEVLMHTGFLRFYELMRPQILEALNVHQRPALYISGHSLGAGVSNVMLYDMIEAGVLPAPQIMALTFAAPRVGNPAFASRMQEIQAKLFQLRNTSDLVPTQPMSTTPSLTGPLALYYYQQAGLGLLFSYIGVNLYAAHSLATYQNYLSQNQLVPYVTQGDDVLRTEE